MKRTEGLFNLVITEDRIFIGWIWIVGPPALMLWLYVTAK